MRPAFLMLLIAVVAWPAGAARAEDLLAQAPGMLEEVVAPLERILGTRFKQPPRVQILSAEVALTAFVEDLRPEVLRRYPEATPGQRRTLLRALAASSVRSTVARYSVNRKSLVLIERERKLTAYHEA